MERRSLLVATGGAAVMVAIKPAPGAARGRAATVAPPNAALHWSAIAEAAIAPGRPPGSAGVLGGIVHAAMHDAAAAACRRFRGLLVPVRNRAPADVDAAVSTAGYLVLAARVPAQAEALAASYTAYLELMTDSPSVRRGRAIGKEVADAVIAIRSGDGLDAVVPWTQPPPGPGVFEPVAANPDGTPATPVDVKLARVAPLVMAAPHQFRPNGPHALTGGAYAADLAEVAAYGRVDSTSRTPAQLETALFWSENTFTQWSRTLRLLAADRRLDTVQAARMLGLTHVAAADALIGCFDAKYHYLYWRPVHAITRADTDGNPATAPVPGWRPLLTVNHPEYPSAHSSWSSAVTATLSGYFGTPRVPMTITSTATGTSRRYRSSTEPSQEVIGARIWAGLHFRGSMLDGARLGRRTSAHVLDRACT